MLNGDVTVMGLGGRDRPQAISKKCRHPLSQAFEDLTRVLSQRSAIDDHAHQLIVIDINIIRACQVVFLRGKF